VSSHKKITLWIMASLGTFFIFLVVLMALLPTLVNLEPIREKILANISRTVGGPVECERLDLSFLPRPRVVIDRVGLSIPEQVTANLGSVTIYPKILPLLKGKLRLAEVKLAAPVFTVKGRKKGQEKAREQPKRFSLASIQETIAPALAVLASKAPGLVVQVENGRLNLGEANQAVFRFQDIRTTMDPPANPLKMDITGFSVEKADPRDSHARAAESPTPLGLHPPKGKWVIKGQSLKAALHVDGDKMTVSLAELNLDQPQINATGTFFLDQTPPRVTLELEGSEVDVPSVRDTALTLAGDIPVTGKIFHVVKGGQVRRIRLTSHGRSLHELGKLENMVIEGDMLKGKICVPKVRLDLDDVNGAVVISDGILHGKNLEARTGNTRGSEGTLKLGLHGKKAPFHLDLLVQADLAQLPAFLKQVVGNQSFAKEMALVEDLKGHGTGRLVLGETTGSIKTRVDVSTFNLSGHYRRIPYPLEIIGKGFSYDERTVQAKQLKGKVGQSSFSGLSVGFDWRQEPRLELQSGRSEIVLGQLYPWLASLDSMSVHLKTLKRAEGVVAFSGLRFKGPLFKPADWHWQVRGEIGRLAVETSLLPGPAQVTGGDFDATEQAFSFRNAQVSILDASSNMSGVLDDYLKGLNRVDMTLQGDMGPEATQWVSHTIRLPRQYYIRPPLSVSQGHLVWHRGAKTSFAGDLVVQHGPEVSLDILRSPEALMIRDLTVRDADSSASLKLGLEAREFSLEYAGHLTKTTMDNLLAGNQCCHGWIQGELIARILLDQPAKSTVQGKLKGEDFILPLNLKPPVSMDSFSVNAATDHAQVESAIFTWADQRMVLGGSAKVSPDGVVLDMDLSADALEWDKVEGLMGHGHGNKDMPQDQASWNLPVRGALRLQTKQFTYHQFTWSPFHADLSFAAHGVHVAVTEANLCGIATPGTLNISPGELLLDFKPVSKNQDLAPTLTCLGEKKGVVTGKFDLDGQVMAQGRGQGILKSVHGNLEFLANNGRIYRYGVLAKVFAFLNLTEVFTGQFPDLTKEGFAYHSMTAKGTLQKGKLVLKDAMIDGPSMSIGWEGDIDLADKKLDIRVLVAPLKTVDLIVGKIPLVKDVLNGTLVSIPVKVTGDWSDPKITPLSPSAVGSGLLGMMKRTLQLPLKIIQPAAPDKN